MMSNEMTNPMPEHANANVFAFNNGVFQFLKQQHEHCTYLIKYVTIKMDDDGVVEMFK